MSIFTGLNARAVVADFQNNRVTITYTTTSTTFSNVPGLSFVLLPNTRYQFTVSVIYFTTPCCNVYAKFAVAPLPAGTTFYVCGVMDSYIGTYSNSGCTGTSQVQITPPTSTYGFYGDMPAVFTGVVSAGPTGGTFQMQVASYNTYAVYVEVNSWIQAQVSSV